MEDNSGIIVGIAALIALVCVVAYMFSSNNKPDHFTESDESNFE